jgi:sugar phosphate permease
MLVGATLATTITAGFIRRYGALRVSQMTLVFAACGLVALPLSFTGTLTIACLGASALLAGFAYGPANPASSHLLVKVIPNNLRVRIFSIKQTSVPIGGAVAGFALPWLTLEIGWQMDSLAVAGMCIFLAIALQPLRRQMDADRMPSSSLLGGRLVATLLVLRHPNLRRLAAASGAFAAMLGPT